MQGGVLTDVIVDNSLEDDQISLEASKIIPFCCRFADVVFLWY